MFASQQGLYSRKFVQVCATCFWTMDRQCNIDRMKFLNKNDQQDQQFQAV